MPKSGRLLALDDSKDNILREGIVFDAEAFDFAQVLLEGGYLGGSPINLDMIPPGNNTHLGVHVLQAGDVLVVDAVKSGRIQRVIEFY